MAGVSMAHLFYGMSTLHTCEVLVWEKLWIWYHLPVLCWNILHHMCKVHNQYRMFPKSWLQSNFSEQKFNWPESETCWFSKLSASARKINILWVNFHVISMLKVFFLFGPPSHLPLTVHFFLNLLFWNPLCSQYFLIKHCLKAKKKRKKRGCYIGSHFGKECLLEKLWRLLFHSDTRIISVLAIFSLHHWHVTFDQPEKPLYQKTRACWITHGLSIKPIYF